MIPGQTAGDLGEQFDDGRGPTRVKRIEMHLEGAPGHAHTNNPIGDGSSRGLTPAGGEGKLLSLALRKPQFLRSNRAHTLEAPLISFPRIHA
jgi:hypothetical protein